MARRVGLLTLVSAAFALVAGGCGGTTAASFDSPTWKEPVKYCAKSPRADMVDDLVAQNLKAGMPMQDVRALLGPPDATDGPSVSYYYVGFDQTSLLGDCILLEVEANDGQLRRAVVVRDG